MVHGRYSFYDLNTKEKKYQFLSGSKHSTMQNNFNASLLNEDYSQLVVAFGLTYSKANPVKPAETWVNFCSQKKLIFYSPLCGVPASKAKEPQGLTFTLQILIIQLQCYS